MAVPHPSHSLGLRLHPRPKYLSLVLIALQRAIAYRGSLFISLFANLIWVAVLYYLWRTVFAGRSQLAGFGWDEMRTYIVVAYAVDSLITFYSVLRLVNYVRTGEIAVDLMRPIDFLLAQLALTFGAALVEGLLGGVLALVVGVMLVGIALPVSTTAALLFFASVWLGFLIKYLVSFLVMLLCFRLLNAVGLVWTQTALLNLLSGALIPLQFFPGWLRTIALAAPFSGIVNTPVLIYLGKLQGLALVQALALQVIWVVALWTMARLLWGPSVRALEIQGG